MRILLIVLLVTAVSCGGSEKKKDAADASSVEAVKENVDFKVETIVLSVDGMTCEGCEKTVETAVAALPGVKSVKASHTNKTASIEVYEGQFEKEKIAAAISKAGYEVLD